MKNQFTETTPSSNVDADVPNLRAKQQAIRQSLNQARRVLKNLEKTEGNAAEIATVHLRIEALEAQLLEGREAIASARKHAGPAQGNKKPELFAARTRQQELRQELAQAVELVKVLRASGQTELVVPVRERIHSLKEQLATGREAIQCLRAAVADAPVAEPAGPVNDDAYPETKPESVKAPQVVAPKAEIVQLRTRQQELRQELGAAIGRMKEAKAAGQPELVAPARERVQSLRAQLAAGRQTIHDLRSAMTTGPAAKVEPVSPQEVAPAARPDIPQLRSRQQELRAEMVRARQALHQLRQAEADEEAIAAARERFQGLRTAVAAGHAVLVAARGNCPKTPEIEAVKQQQQALRAKAFEVRSNIQAAKSAGAHHEAIVALKEQHAALRNQLADGREKLQALRRANHEAKANQAAFVAPVGGKLSASPRAGRRAPGRHAHWRAPVVVTTSPLPEQAPEAPAETVPERAAGCEPHAAMHGVKKTHWKHDQAQAGPPFGKPFARMHRRAPGFTLTVEAGCPPFTAHFTPQWAPAFGRPHGRKWVGPFAGPDTHAAANGRRNGCQN